MSGAVDEAGPLPEGRRARSKAAKLARIRAAADELFTARGFAAVTTSEIAERADVAEGTLFRYAASKAELLLMVHNDRLRAALAAGRAAADAGGAAADDPVAAVVALVAPIAAAAGEQPDDGRAYQRELLFGTGTDRYCAEGLDLIAELEDEVARHLLAAGVEAADAVPAARAVVAVLHHAVADTAAILHPGRDPAADLDRQIALIVAGCRFRPAPA